MSTEPTAESIPTDDFDAVYRAVSETARGRWFIQEFLKRSGSANTQLIIDVIGQLRSDIAPAPAAATTIKTDDLHRELAQMSQSITNPGGAAGEAHGFGSGGGVWYRKLSG